MGAIWNVVDKFLQPFRVLQGKWMGVKAVPQGLVGDVKRIKGQAGGYAQDVKGAGAKIKGVQGKVQGAQGQMQQYGQQGQQFQQQAGQFGPPQGMGPPGMPPPGQFPGQFPQQPPPKAKKMGLFGRKKVCPQCGQPQEKNWDACPYCMQAAMASGPPGANNGPAAPQKTVAFMAGGMPGQAMQLLGWLVPLEGAQRGELFTLKPQTQIGTDPSQCDVVLMDPYMSSKHAVIKAQAGVFVLEDGGSTNGTQVNSKRVSRHELVDNDLIMFGKTPCKFKSL
jgi:hypothetical protein